MRILVACEESHAVTKELRLLGHEAFSCDILPCGGENPEWHIEGDVIPQLEKYSFKDGCYVEPYWDMIIAFPPCTHLAVSGARHFAKKIADGRQQQGIDLFMAIANAYCDKIAIENPVGIMSSKWRKPDQVIQPWQFGDEAQKTTCLWLKGLPKLVPTNIVGKGEFYIAPSGKKLPKWYNHNTNNKADRQKSRSVTFNGIAKAMADQWTKPFTNLENLQSALAF